MSQTLIRRPSATAAPVERVLGRDRIPRPEDLPIPANPPMGKGWTDQMIEMASHIGARAVLQIVDALGGEYITVPRDPAKGRLQPIIGPEKSAIMSQIYGRERLKLPTAKTALAVARRAGVLAAVRAKALTAADAARILRTSRTYLNQLLAEGEGNKALPTVARSARQIDLFGD